MRIVAPVAPTVLLLAAVASAGDTGRSKHVVATLLSETTAIRPGSPFRLGLQLKMAPEWHTYWANPGDSGLPTRVQWDLPDGFAAGPIQWPVPERIQAGPLVSYGYHDEVLLLTEVTPPVRLGRAEVPVRATVSWLECQEACLPGRAELEVTLPLGTPEPSVHAGRFDEARRRLPGDGSGWRFQAVSGGGKIELAFKPEGVVRGATFLPLDKEVVDYAADQELRRDGDGYLLGLKPAVNARRPPSLAGVLVVESPGGRRGVSVQAPLAVGPAAATSSTQAPLAAASESPPRPASRPIGLLLALGLAFVGGLILNLMPCVLPVLSLKVMGFVRQAGEDSGAVWKHGLAFTAGVLASFWSLAGVLLALRAGGEQIGWGFQLQSPSFLVFLAGLFFLIGLNLFGVFEVGGGLTRAGGLVAGRSGLGASFASGGLATLVATPCTAPFMGSALGFGLSQPAHVALLVFTSLGLGMAAPYLVLSTSPRLLRLVPRPGPWMERLREVMGFVMMATVVAVVWLFGRHTGPNGMAVLLAGILLAGLGAWVYGRYGSPLASARARMAAAAVALVLIAGGIGLGMAQAQEGTPGPSRAVEDDGWEPFSPQRVAELRRSGRPVFVDFTADWCLTCKVNERVALSRPAVTGTLARKNVALVKADWTQRDERITRGLAEHGRQGVPLYVLYPPGAEPVLLPVVLTEDLVLRALERLRETDD